MFDIIKKNKFTVGIIVVLIIAAFLYQVYVAGDGGDQETGDQETGTTTASRGYAVGQQVTELSGRIENVEINAAFLRHSVYRNLDDFGYEADRIPARGSGTNPFAPIAPSGGSDVTSL